MKENEKKGKDFELYVGKEYETLGYTVSYNGIGRKRKDEGIDIIAKNYQEILLIQCKNWKSKKITHKELKEFIANCMIYKEKYLKNEKRNIKNIYITSNDILEKSAKYFINENKNIIQYETIKY